MRKLLDNPYFVGLLVIGAIIIAFRKPLFSWLKDIKSAPTISYVSTNVTAIAEKIKPQTPPPPPVEVLPDTKIDVQNIQWILTPTRNPFKKVAKKDATRTNTVENVAPQPEQQFKLSGIVVEKTKKFAVINNQILSEGDTISGYRVITIEQDYVVLEGFNQKRKITFGENNSD